MINSVNLKLLNNYFYFNIIMKKKFVNLIVLYPYPFTDIDHKRL